MNNHSEKIISSISISPAQAFCAFAISAAFVSQGFAQNKDGSVNRAGAINPYADNNGYPLPPNYSGPVYKLNHAYPQQPVAEPANPPWREALGGKPIGQTNSIAYVNALKNYIAPQVSSLVNDYKSWDPVKANWYAAPWIAPAVGSWPGRGAIQGAYPGPGFGKQFYGVALQDYAIVYYNPTAAFTLYNVWQHNAHPYLPNVKAAQFEEGAIVIKLAVTTAQGDDASKPNYWPVLKGSAKSKVYQAPFQGKSKQPVVTDVTALQFDLIVKDTKTTTEAGSETGWVFATLVYDKDAPGETVWDRMVPLGAMWGNDPEVASVDPDANVGENPNQELQQTVVNPAAPDYAKITLGYGGRLSGPNDAAANIAPPASVTLSGKSYNFYRMSSCMSCHGTAAFAKNPPSLVPVVPKKGWLDPGSDQFLEYFQSRPGNVPQVSGQIPLDYDMVLRQALINLKAASGSKEGIAESKKHVDGLRARGGYKASGGK